MSPSNNPPPTIEYILLGLLHQAPSHGYGLYEKIKGDESLSQIWQIKRSKLYYLLEKLESQKLIQSTRISGENRPARKEYHLTEKGTNAFLSWIETPVKKARYVRLVFLARLYFSLRIGKHHALNLISKQRTLCQTWIESLQTKLNAIDTPSLIITQAFTFRIGQIQAMLDWLAECETHI
ncbi:MAG: PadR family transcriptional regulator [Chloroflexota bacterium]|nr:PadR family transcriptional regulator [Chloroflexota bacterium]